MQLAPHNIRSADPLAWFLVEQRGPIASHGNRYSLTTLEASTNELGRAHLADGRMTYPKDRGITEFKFESVPFWVREGVDPEAAAAAALEGVSLLAESIQRALPDLEQYRVVQNARLPRDPDTFEVWTRSEYGARGRFIVPYGAPSAAIADVQRAARALAETMRRDYERQDPGPQDN